MTTFETIGHIELNENYQGINLTDFAFVVGKHIESAQIVDIFIRSNYFMYESLRDNVKLYPEKGYLRRALDFTKINVTDFKKFSNNETSDYLSGVMNEPDWGDDRDEFAKLLDKYFEIHHKYGEREFYVVSKDWFDSEDEKLFEPESWIYCYYFLFISLDRQQSLLTVTEWTYD